MTTRGWRTVAMRASGNSKTLLLASKLRPPSRPPNPARRVRMADHSPLPWRVMLDETFGGDKAVDGIAAADGVVIEDMIHPDDAEFICRAVNHHDALLAALKALVYSAHPSKHEHPAMFDAWQKAHA